MKYGEVIEPGANGICTITVSGDKITHATNGYYSTTLIKVYGVLK